MNEVTDKIETCPVCSGSGVVTISREQQQRFLAHLETWAALRDKSNAELASLTTEIQECLRGHDVPQSVFQWIDEVWWRLHIANEPVEDTARKIKALGEDEEWLKAE